MFGVDAVVDKMIVLNEENPSLLKLNMSYGSSNMFAITFKDSVGTSYRNYFDVWAYQVNSSSSNPTPIMFVPCNNDQFSYKDEIIKTAE
jgi:hypothetical protein